MRLPAAVLIVLTESILRSLYRSPDGHGIIAIRPQMLWRLGGAVLGSILIVIALITAIAIAANLLHPLLTTWVAGTLYAYMILSLLVSISLPNNNTLRQEVRAMTARDTWTITVFAQRPGTRWSAIALTRDLIDQLMPAGTCITITAREPRHEKIYQRAGFIPAGNKTMTTTSPLRRQ